MTGPKCVYCHKRHRKGIACRVRDREEKQMKKRPLKEIAAAISTHLHRFEASKKINAPHPKYKTRPYYMAWSGASGAYVKVVYVSYQGSSCLRREEAEAYLAWLDARNVGRHYEQQREQKPKLSRRELRQKLGL